MGNGPAQPLATRTGRDCPRSARSGDHFREYAVCVKLAGQIAQVLVSALSVQNRLPPLSNSGRNAWPTHDPARHPYFSAGIASASAMICRPAILNSGAHPAPASVIESCATASPAIALIISKRLVIRICTRSYHSFEPRCTARSLNT